MFPYAKQKSFTTGECCCTLTDESKCVYALVNYPVGFIPFDLGTLAGDQMPPKCYLTRTIDWINSADEIALHQVGSYDPRDVIFALDTGASYDHTGSVTFDSSEPPPGTVVVTETTSTTTYASGDRIVVTLSNPYTYADAAAAAETMLALVPLLDTGATYLNQTDSEYFHFCYPSEAAAAGYSTGQYVPGYFGTDPAPYASNVIYIKTWAVRTYGVITSSGYHYFAAQVFPPPYNPGDWYPAGANMVLANNGGAYRTSVSGYDSPNYFYGHVWGSKLIIRHTHTFTDYTTNLWNSSTFYFDTTGPTTVSILPGEDIFLSTDVPGLGWAYWTFH